MPSRTTKRSIMTVFTVQTDRSNDLMKTPRCHLINENSDRTISLDFLEGGEKKKKEIQELYLKKSNFNKRKIKYPPTMRFPIFFHRILNIQSINLSALQTSKIDFVTFLAFLIKIILENLQIFQFPDRKLS